MKTPRGAEGNLGPGDVVLDGVDLEVDLAPGHIVGHGVPAPRERGTAAPLFGPCLLWPRSPISAIAELLFCTLNINNNSVRDIFYIVTFQNLLSKPEFIVSVGV